ncbi:hypothetical protein BDV06DRAFT_115583 [Aspergillus oleicola]
MGVEEVWRRAALSMQRERATTFAWSRKSVIMRRDRTGHLPCYYIVYDLRIVGLGTASIFCRFAGFDEEILVLVWSRFLLPHWGQYSATRVQEYSSRQSSHSNGHRRLIPSSLSSQPVPTRCSLLATCYVHNIEANEAFRTITTTPVTPNYIYLTLTACT